MRAAAELGLDTLVEAHDAEELDRAVRLGAEPIGLNARDLGTFAIDRRAQLELVASAPRDRIVIAESAVHSRAQAAAAELAGADAVLVGTALMRAADPEATLRGLLSRPLVKVCGLTREEDVAVAAEAGADLLGFILARESPRRAEAVLPVPDTALAVAVLVGEHEETGADLTQLYEREGDHRSRDAVLLRGDEPVGRVVDLPWAGGRPGPLGARRGRERPRRPRRPPRRRQRARGDRARPPLGRRRQLARSRPRPGVKDHDAVRAFVEAAR